MRKAILILLIVAIAVMFTACNAKLDTTEWEQRVIVDACNELEISTLSVVGLELVNVEYVAWLGCDVYTYIITMSDGTRYVVGARENKDGFYCDVEGIYNGEFR